MGQSQTSVIERATVAPGPTRAIVTASERNVEMGWVGMDPDAYLVPNDRFFIRSHGAAPRIDPLLWRLRIEGPGARRSVEFTYDDLLHMANDTVVRALECAGNGRLHFARAHARIPAGERWGLGAIGVAQWTGVPLGLLLDRAGMTPAATEVLPEGLDEARVRRPIPRRKAMDDTMVIVAMNGEPLPVDHGFPARLLVPGWAAVASIKWLGRIHVPVGPVRTPWNSEHYVLRGPAYEVEQTSGRGAVPITEQVMKSALELEWPARLQAGASTITGRSWSPTHRIAKVDVSVDGGPWFPARLRPPNVAGAWVRWSFDWMARPGRHSIRVRATDDSGMAQPERVPWNEGGYLYGAVVDHPVQALDSTTEEESDADRRASAAR